MLVPGAYETLARRTPLFVMAVAIVPVAVANTQFEIRPVEAPTKSM
jgi:hypothetical protein